MPSKPSTARTNSSDVLIYACSFPDRHSANFEFWSKPLTANGSCPTKRDQLLLHSDFLGELGAISFDPNFLYHFFNHQEGSCCTALTFSLLASSSSFSSPLSFRISVALEHHNPPRHHIIPPP